MKRSGAYSQKNAWVAVNYNDDDDDDGDGGCFVPQSAAAVRLSR